MNSDLMGRTLGEADWRVEEKFIMESNQKMTRDDLRMLHEALCEEARTLMKAKNADYAAISDPFRNFRLFGELGILVRLSDKLARLRSFLENGKLEVKNETVRDTILDIINYAVLFQGYLLDSPRPACVNNLQVGVGSIKDSAGHPEEPVQSPRRSP